MKQSVESLLIQSVLEGRLSFFRSGAIFSPLPGASFCETEDAYIYTSGMDYACENGVIEKVSDRIPSLDEIDQIVAYFSSKNLPFMWWSSASILETKGFQYGGILQGIALSLSEEIPLLKEVSPSIDVSTVDSESSLRSFTEIAANGFLMSQKAKEQFFLLNHSLMDHNEVIHFIASIDEIAVGVVSLSLSEASAGIWNLATSAKHRNKGVATALVHAALLEAKRRGADTAIALLMPKGMAFGLFTKLGFQPLLQFPFYVYGVDPEELED